MHLCFQNITKHILMGISFAKGVERPITVMGIEKNITGQCRLDRGYDFLVSLKILTGHMPSF
jgi:hypothetical protein